MTKILAVSAAVLTITMFDAASCAAQAPVPGLAAPPTSGQTDDTLSRRQQALAKLFEGQRHLWKLQRMQTQAGRALSRKLAQEAFEASLRLDPTLAESHTALSQLAVAVAPRDIEEGIRQASLAVKTDRENIGGHRMLARLYTAKSRLNNGELDLDLAAKAESEWREVARIEPRNAEAWAFLAAFAEARDRTEEQVEALRKWVSAAPPADVGFYEGTMTGASLSPDFASMKLAGVLVKTGKYVEAAEILGDLIAEDPENPEAVELLSEVVDVIDPDLAGPAVTTLEQAAFANSDNFSLVDSLARLQTRRGKFEDAASMLKGRIDALAKTDARRASALSVSLSDVYLQQDRYSDAEAALNAALALRRTGGSAAFKEEDREFVESVFERLIHVAKVADRPQSARENIARAKRLLGKDNTFADRQMIQLLRGQGLRREALTLARSLRAGSPADVRLLRTEAELLVDLGQADSAVDLIERAGALKSTGVSGSTVSPATDRFSDLLFISNLYSRAGKGQQAIKAANEALAAAGGSERRQIAKTTLATAQETSGDTAAAEKTLREILAETPGNPMALNNLGYFLAERGEKLDEAIRMITQALKVDSRNPYYLDSLGWAHFRAGRLEDSERYLLAAARLDADSSTIREHLGDLYQAKKDITKARSMWEGALRLSSAAEDSARIKKKLGR